MKTMTKILFGVLASGLVATSALAAVNGSHHDLSTWSSGSTQEVCLYCHGVRSTTDVGDFGTIGALCVTRCHAAGAGSDFAASTNPIPNRPATATDAGVGVAPNPTLAAIATNPGNTAYSGSIGHGLNKLQLYNKYGAANVTLANSPAATANYPYVAAGNTIECTSCHNVHANTWAPFIFNNLFDSGATGGAGISFCQDCHYPSGSGTPDGRGNNWSASIANPNGDHPVNLALVLGDAARTSIATNPRQGRYIAFDVFNGTAVFDVASDMTALSAQSDVYVTGGKVGDLDTATDTATAVNGKIFGCYSCHSAHMDTGSGNPSLLLRDPVSANAETSPLCVSCHGNNAATLDDDNPGLAASIYFHPANTLAPTGTLVGGTIWKYKNTNGTFFFNVDLARPAGFGTQGSLSQNVGIDTADGAPTGKPRCNSCHDVHGGINNSMALADLDGTEEGAFTGTFCNACHGGSNLPDVIDNTGNAGEIADATAAGSHHRTGAAWCADRITADTGDIHDFDAASWAGAAGSPGDCADGLGCVDCHVFDGSVHSTAHNW